MMSDYTSMISQIITWIDHSDVDTAIAQDLIQLGESRVYKEVRVSSMETTLSVTMSGGVASLPSDFLSLKSARVAGSPDQPLGIVSAEQIYREYPTRSSDSKPLFCAIEAGNIIFGPFPDSNYDVKGIYYKRLTALSASNTTNYFTGDGAAALFFASLVEAEQFIKNDNRVILWEAKYKDSITMINKEEKRRLHSGGPLRMRAS